VAIDPSLLKGVRAKVLKSFMGEDGHVHIMLQDGACLRVRDTCDACLGLPATGEAFDHCSLHRATPHRPV
jgi:hypothetical protein